MRFKATIAAVAIGASLLTAGVAQAGTYHPVRCKSPYRGFVQSMTVSRISCARANVVAAYWISHEITSQPVRIAGYRWFITRWISGRNSMTTDMTTGAPRLGAPTILIRSLPYG